LPEHAITFILEAFCFEQSFAARANLMHPTDVISYFSSASTEDFFGLASAFE